MNLRDVEAAGPGLVLTGERLFSALYVNELMTRLLRGHEGEAMLFSLYSGVLAGLAADTELEPLLRSVQQAWNTHADRKLLADLSDHQLRDIGIRREHIPHIIRQGWDI